MGDSYRPEPQPITYALYWQERKTQSSHWRLVKVLPDKASAEVARDTMKRACEEGPFYPYAEFVLVPLQGNEEPPQTIGPAKLQKWWTRNALGMFS